MALMLPSKSWPLGPGREETLFWRAGFLLLDKSHIVPPSTTEAATSVASPSSCSHVSVLIHAGIISYYFARTALFSVITVYISRKGIRAAPVTVRAFKLSQHLIAQGLNPRCFARETAKMLQQVALRLQPFHPAKVCIVSCKCAASGAGAQTPRQRRLATQKRCGDLVA